MHVSALKTGKLFFDTYAAKLEPGATVLDVGSQDVNGSLKGVCPHHLKYVGVDFVAGKGVDVVIDDPYKLPFPDASFDAVVCSSCLEHAEMFWLVFLEMLRVLKPAGLLYVNSPSNGNFHRYPVDCWRFYPDSGNALVRWAERSGYGALLLESFIGRQDQDCWNDFVAVFVRDKASAAAYPARIFDVAKADVANAFVHGRSGIQNPRSMTEDQEKLAVVLKVVNGSIKVR